MIRLVFFLEKPSAKAMLESFLPKILPPNVTFRCHFFEGKQQPAVAKALNLPHLEKHQHKENHRDPDKLKHPSKQLQKLTKNIYQKIQGSRLIGLHLTPDNTRSCSFKNFVQGIQKLMV